MADDEWVVVGGSGKAKKGSKRGSSQLAQQPIQAQAPTAVPHAIPAAVAPLPGWEGGTAEGCASQSVPRGTKPRRGKHQLLERSTEELAADLKQQVLQCRSDIEGSSIFASLQQAFLAGAPHLPFQIHKPPSQPPPQTTAVGSSNVSPPEPLLDHSHQHLQQHQHQQEHQQEHSRGEQQIGQQPLLQRQHSHVQEPQLKQRQQQQQQQQLLYGGPEDCAGDGQGLLAPQHGWHHVKEFVIFGLGSMQTSSTSRYQLAMASLLATKLLPGLQAPPMAFDPAFTPADVALLHLMGIAVISNNQLCAHRAHVPTFFYLPHLEGRLCDNLLAANSSRADRAPHASTMHTPEGGSNMGMLPQRFESSNMSTPPQRLDSVDSASHPSTAHAPNNGCSNVGMQPPNVVCTQADGSGVSSAQGSCSSATYAPDFTSNSAEETASEVICGGRTESCETKECSSNAPGSPPGTCTNHRHQHTLHNCVLLANRFSTYEGRAPGTTASVGGGPGRCLGIKQGGKGGKGRKLGGHTEGSQHGNGAADAAQGGGGGLEALLASGRPATMVSLVSAGAVLELQVKEDKHFPSPSAFNDMALHIIP